MKSIKEYIYSNNNIPSEFFIKKEDVKVGDKIQYRNGKNEWETSTIKRVSKDFVWFSGSSVTRLGKTTIKNNPSLYKLI